MHCAVFSNTIETFLRGAGRRGMTTPRRSACPLIMIPLLCSMRYFTSKRCRYSFVFGPLAPFLCPPPSSDPTSSVQIRHVDGDIACASLAFVPLCLSICLVACLTSQSK